MKRPGAILCILSLCTVLSADEIPFGILEEAADHLVIVDYRFTTADKVPVSYSGTARFQKSCFRISGNGMDIRCDGIAIYVIDTQAKEVYIQTPATLESFIKDNIGAVRDFTLGRKETLQVSSDTTQFTYDVTAIDKSWVVTDLR